MVSIATVRNDNSHIARLYGPSLVAVFGKFSTFAILNFASNKKLSIASVLDFNSLDKAFGLIGLCTEYKQLVEQAV